MTSRRIERHKNYAGLMDQHRRVKRSRNIVRWAILFLIIVMGLIVVYYATDRKNEPSTPVEMLDGNK
jgi:uncharacterized membrane protein YvbJ